jgi:hypothetical protein
MEIPCISICPGFRRRNSRKVDGIGKVVVEEELFKVGVVSACCESILKVELNKRLN